MEVESSQSRSGKKAEAGADDVFEKQQAAHESPAALLWLSSVLSGLPQHP